MIKFPETAPNDPTLLEDLGGTLEDFHSEHGRPFYFLFRADHTTDALGSAMNTYPFAPEILPAAPGVIYEPDVQRYHLLDDSKNVDDETKWYRLLNDPQSVMAPLAEWEGRYYEYLSDPKSEIVHAGTRGYSRSPLLKSKERDVDSFLLNPHMQKQVGRVAELAIYWQTEVPDMYIVGADGTIETFNISVTETFDKISRQIDDHELTDVIDILKSREPYQS